MKKKVMVGVALLFLILIVLIGVYLLFPISKGEACSLINTLDNSDDASNAIDCYLNNEKQIFSTDAGDGNVLEVLKGTCNITKISDRYLDKNNQYVNAPCTNCRLEGARVWFKCSEYQSQFGCYFNINKDLSFGEIYCPIGV